MSNDFYIGNSDESQNDFEVVGNRFNNAASSAKRAWVGGCRGEVKAQTHKESNLFHKVA